MPRKEHKLPVTSESDELLKTLKTLRSLTSFDRRKQYEQQLSECDKLINAIYHKIETANCNAAQICVIYRDLRTALIKRRQAKNMLSALDTLKPHTIATIASSTVVDQIAKKMKVSWSSDYDPKKE